MNDDYSDLPPLPPIGQADDGEKVNEDPVEGVPDEDDPVEAVKTGGLGDEPNRPLNGLEKIGPKEFGRRLGPLFGGLFLLYLLISANFVGELFSCQLQRIFRQNNWAKHMLGLATLFLVINVVAGNAIPWSKGLLFGVTVAMYLLFVLSNRTTAHTQLFILVALAIIYALEMVRDEQANIIRHDPNEETKEVAVQKRERVLIASYTLSALILLAILIGHVVYVGRQKMQVGADFSYTKMFGISECSKMNLDNYDDFAAFKAFFQPASTFSRTNSAANRSRAASMTPQAPTAESPRPHFADAVSWFDNGSNMSSQYSMQ